MRRRTRSTRILIVALGALLLVPGAALGDEPIAITEPVHVTEGDLVPTRTYSAPFLAADPANEAAVVAGFVEMRSRICGLMRSFDRGQTWERVEEGPGLPAYPFCFHTSGGVTQTPLAFGRDSTLYYGLAGWDEQDGGSRGNISVLLGRTSDYGDTWDTTIVRDARGFEGDEVENNRPVSGVAVDTSGSSDVVYVTWRSGSWPDVNPMIAVSTDGGETFSEPVNVMADHWEDPANMEMVDEAFRSSDHFAGSNPAVTVDDAGTVYVLWERLTPGVDDAPERASYVSRSSDQGATWDVNRASAEMPNLGGSIIRWGPGGGSEGTLHIIYHGKPEQPAGLTDIFYQRSTDRGATWSEPVMLNDDDPAQQVSKFHPTLSVAPNGRVDAAWWDFRDDPGLFVNDVYHAFSTDAGQTWSDNIRVTDRSVNRRIGPWANNFDMRQPVGMASVEPYTLFGWDDTRHGDEVSQAQDLYAAAVQHRAIGNALPRLLAFLVAGFLGLLVVGIALGVVAMLTRRRLEPAPPDVDDAAQEADAVETR